VGALESRISGARWVPKDNLHLTLAFLGRVDDNKVNEIGEAIAGAVRDHVDFTVRLGELGAVPSLRRARVVWAGVVDPTNGTVGVADSGAGAMGALGFPREKRSFSPHVTLARLKMPGPVQLGEELEPIVFSVERISLFESHLGRPNAVYSELATFPFRRGS
jgi:2'-5' RNA ligase